MESYNSVYVQQFETFYNTKLKKEKELEEKIAEGNREVEKWKSMQRDLEQEKELRIQLLESKDNDIKRLNENQTALEEQLYKLNKIISKD